MIDAPNNTATFPLPLTGEMGGRIAQFDWAATPLGRIEDWTSALKNIVSTICAVPFPMALYWGEDYINLYNDAFITTLGTEGKHPSILGKPRREAFPETVEFVDPLFNSVLHEAKSIRYEDQLVPIYRNGKLDDVYWTFSYSPVYDDDGMVGGVLVVCSETTQKVKDIIEKEEQFRTLAHNSPDIITRFDKNRKYTYASPVIEKVTGIPSDQFIGKNYRELNLPKELCDFFDKHLDVVYNKKEAHSVEYYTPDKTAYLSTRIIPELDSDGNLYSVLAISTDITARKNIEDELVYQKTILESVTENTDLALFLMDERQYCIYMNEAAEKMTGFTLEELKGKKLHYYVHHTHPDGRHYPLEECPIDQALPANKRMKGEEVFVNKDGSFYPVAFTASPIYIDGKAIGTVIEVRETAEEKKKEQELLQAVTQQKQAFALLEGLLKNAPIGFAFFDTEYRYVKVNERLAEINGIPIEAHIGKTFSEVLPHNAKAVIPILEQVFATGKAFDNVEVVGYTPKEPGVERVWLAGFYPVFDVTGKAVEFVGVTVIEITERKKAEQALRESEEQFRNFSNNIQNLAWIAEGDGFIYWYNNRWYSYTGTTQEEMMGWGWQQVHHPDHVERVVSFVKEAWGKGEQFELTFPLRSKEGEYRWFLTRACPIKDESGNTIKWIGTNTDIHEQIELQRALRRSEELLETKVTERTKELQEANNTLLHLNAELTQFTYITSHDLQEPLRKISVFSQQIEQTDYQTLSETAKRNFGKIIDAVKRMRSSLQDLLEYSTLDSEATFVPVDLNKIVEGVQQDLEMLIKEKNAVIHSGRLPLLQAIPVQMQQLFTNIINNALKYSKAGVPAQITITAKPFDAASPNAANLQLNKEKKYIDITIADNGIGFTPDHAEKIFMLFQRLHGKSQYSGTGIGLAICKKVTLRHRGNIYAEGKEGECALFHIILPTE